MFPGLHPLFLGSPHTTAREEQGVGRGDAHTAQACSLQPFPEALEGRMGEDEDSPSKERNRPRVSSRWVSENAVIWDGGGEQRAEGENTRSLLRSNTELEL